MNKQRKFIVPMVMIFIVTNCFLLLFGQRLAAWGVDRDMLLGANVLFFAVSIIAFLLQRSALQNANPNVFIRSVMGSMFIKMMLVLVVFVIYIMIVRKGINKPAVFGAMFLYLLYLAAEVAGVMKLNKQKNA
jgi:hypothetical protein